MTPSSVLIAAAVVLYLLSLGLYLIAGESWLVRLAWAASVLLLILSQVQPVQVKSLLRYWLANWRSYGLPMLVLLVALGLRSYRLTAIPQDLHGDMASHGLQARAILDGTTNGIVGVGWADIPLVGFLPAASTMWLSGDHGLLGLNLASIIGGVLSIWGLYVLMVQISSRQVALVATTLLAINYTHIHFSRIAEYMDPVPLGTWALAFLAIGLDIAAAGGAAASQRPRGLSWVLSGVLLALAGLMYFSGRVATVIAAVILLYHLLFKRRLLWESRRGLLLMACGFLLALGPQLIYFLQYIGPFLSRSRAVVLTNPDVLTHLKGKYGVDTFGAVLWEQVKRSLLMFSYYGDSSTQFGFPHPIVDSYTAPLVALGFGYALRHWRQPSVFFMLSFLGCVLVLGSILTNNAPFWPRLVLILPPAMALAALTVDRFWEAIRGVVADYLDQVLASLLVGGLIYVGLQNWLLYYPFAAHNGRPRAIVGRVIDSLPPTAVVCLVPEPDEEPNAWIHSVGEREIAFFVPPRQAFDVPAEHVLRPAAEAAAFVPPLCQHAGAVWLVPTSQQPVLRQLQVRYPGGKTASHGPRRTEVILYTYALPQK